ncbi:MAG: CBS domain-containing protein [Thermoplasmatales archaeon]|nr:CBS domain-containing protein [Thermoplasmatales archaeon]
MGLKDLQDLKKLSMLRSQIEGTDLMDIASRDFPTLSPDARVVDAVSLMRESGLQDIPVVEANGDYIGMISYSTILKRRNVKMDAKIGKMVSGYPMMEKGAKVTQVAETMIVNNYRQLPIMDGNRRKVGAIISRGDLVGVAAGIKTLAEIKVWEIMTTPVESVGKDASLSEAIEIMGALDIKTVPLVDSKNHVVGILGMKEIIDYYWKGDVKTVADLSGEKGQKSETTAHSICATAVKTVEWDDSLAAAASIMDEWNISTIPVLDDGELVGVLTQYDIVELISAAREREMVFIQISGLDDQDKGNIDLLYASIENEIPKIAKIMRPDSLTMHVAKYHEKGDRNKYSITARLTVEGNVVSMKEVSWDIVQGVNNLMKKLTSAVVSFKETRLDYRQKRSKR